MADELVELYDREGVNAMTLDGLSRLDPDLAKIADTALHFWANEESIQTDHKRCRALARYELGRRHAAAQQKLTRMSTIYASAGAAVAALLGAVVGAWLKS